MEINVPMTSIELRTRRGKRTVDCKIVKNWISLFSGCDVEVGTFVHLQPAILVPCLPFGMKN
jgi:hypothetical protein